MQAEQVARVPIRRGFLAIGGVSLDEVRATGETIISRADQEITDLDLEKVLETQPLWADHAGPNPQRIWELIGGTGLDIAKARAAMHDPAIRQALEQDMADMAALKVSKTPSFFVNGTPLSRFGVEELRTLVSDELQRAKAK